MRAAGDPLRSGQDVTTLLGDSSNRRRQGRSPVGDALLNSTR